MPRPITPAAVPASLACVATATHRARPEDSQDAAGVAAPAGGFPALLVADGLGSFAHAGAAARLVAREAQAALESPARSGDIAGLFPRLQARLGAVADEWEAAHPEARLDRRRAFGTTLLAAVERPEALLVAYVGNGSIFHIRGDFADWGAGRALPWSFANCLNPHSVCENGREALCRYLSASGDPDQAEPTALLLRKDRRCGDLLLLCTDGVFSSDQVRHGNPGDGSVWGEVPAPLLAVHAALRAAWDAPGDLTAGGLGRAMEGCLSDLRAQGALEDDATLGLLVTGRARAYRDARREATRGDTG